MSADQDLEPVTPVVDVDLPPICAACRAKIGASWRITTRPKVYVLCGDEDCARWARIRGLELGPVAVPVEAPAEQPTLFLCTRSARRPTRRR